MKPSRIVCFALFVCGATAMTYAQSTQHIGSWSIYTIANVGKTSVMLQTPAIEQNADSGDGKAAVTLNVLCRNNKLVAIALHSAEGIDEHAFNDVQEVPTIQIVASNGGHVQAEKWAVTEKGHTLIPYSQFSQGKRNRQWLERLNAAQTVSFQLGGSQTRTSLQPSFHTEQLEEALSAAGCKR
jgi:hypothetical protein